MKSTFILCSTFICAFLLCITNAHAQYSWKRGVGIAVSSGVAGASWGLNQSLNYKYPEWKLRHQKANDQFWDPSKSWTNKYAGGVKENGPKFVGSTNFLVGLTYANHLTHQITFVGVASVGFIIGHGKKRPWWYYLVDIGISGAAFYGGMAITYIGTK